MSGDGPARAALAELGGPAGWEAARTGAVRFTGGDDPVLRSPFRLGAAGAAAVGAAALAADALWRLRDEGRRPAQAVAVDVRRAAASLRSNRYLRIDGRSPEDPFDPLTGIYPTGDGRHAYLHCNFPQHRAGVAEMLGAAPTRDGFAAALSGRGAAEVEAGLIARNLAGGLVRSAAEWAAHAQGQAVADLPLLEITRLGPAPAEPLPGGGERPLAGVRVLDLTRVLAGPTAARTLAEHGAEVLKITAPHLADSGSLELDTGHGKRAAFLDLRDAAGAERLRALAAEADVFVQSYRPGTLAARGFGPEALAALRPGIVCATLSAFGHAGPWRRRRGFDTVVQCVSGWAARSAGEDGRPALQPASAVDYVSGYLLAFGVMVALERRAREGGSWLVRGSLAQTGHWIAGLGEVAGDWRAAVPAEFPAEALADWSVETTSPAGLLRHLGPVAEMSATPPRWDRPAVPLGTHPAAW